MILFCILCVISSIFLLYMYCCWSYFLVVVVVLAFDSSLRSPHKQVMIYSDCQSNKKMYFEDLFLIRTRLNFQKEHRNRRIKTISNTLLVPTKWKKERERNTSCWKWISIEMVLSRLSVIWRLGLKSTNKV